MAAALPIAMKYRSISLNGRPLELVYRVVFGLATEKGYIHKAKGVIFSHPIPGCLRGNVVHL